MTALSTHESQERFAATLHGYATLLAARLETFGARTEPAAAPLVAELATAVEQLRVAEAELRAQTATQRDYHALSDLIPDAHLVTSPDGVIREANQATSALIGYARTYVLGKPLAALLAPGSVAAFTAKLAALRQAPDGRVQSWEAALRAPRARPPILTSIRVAPILDEAGTLAGFRWLLRDVSEPRATAAALAELKERQAQQLRTRTMELEAVVRMQAETRALDRAALQGLVRDAIRALQHGAESGALVAHLLTALQAQLAGPVLVRDEHTATA